MWVPQDFKVQLNKLDFSSSGQGISFVRQLLADNVEISNAIEYVDWDNSHLQTIVCGHCGTPGCENGNWVSIRQCGEYVVIIPAFTQMLEGDWELDEYRAPSFIHEKGCVLLEADSYSILRNLVNGLSEKDDLLQLTLKEVLFLLQFEAPQNILGRFPNRPILNRQFVLATNQKDDELLLKKLEELILKSLESEEVVVLEQLDEIQSEVQIYIDQEKFEE